MELWFFYRTKDQRTPVPEECNSDVGSLNEKDVLGILFKNNNLDNQIVCHYM